MTETGLKIAFAEKICYNATAMRPYTGTVERAFQLAERCKSIREIRAALKDGGYSNVDLHLSGRSIQSDLKAAISKHLPAARD